MRRQEVLTYRKNLKPPLIEWVQGLHSRRESHKKRRPFGLLFCLQCFRELLHDELLGVGTSVHEVDTAVQAADVDAVGTSMALLAHDLLTHDVVNHDLGIVAEGDVELVNGGVGEEGHVDVVAGMIGSAV